MRNMWVIYREGWDNLLKGELIPDEIAEGQPLVMKVGDCKRPDAS